jgi:L-seryl-tRNA(Ser) seleniumtransferase
MKVSKEQIVGMVAAVDWFLSQTDASLEAEFRRRADKIAAQLKNIPTLTASVVIPNVAANAVPHLLLRYDTQRIKIRPVDVMAELRKGTPSIELNPQTGKKPGAGLPSDESTIVVGVWMLQPGQDLIVARRIKEILERASA